MSTDTSTATRTECPVCRTKGKRVAVVTLRSLLKPELATTLQAGESCECSPAGECRTPTEDTGWRFCDSAGCEVVYFSETTEQQFTEPDLTVDVGVKQTDGPRSLCYCFGHSVASIKDELRAKGRSEALEDIRVKMNDSGCHCATANPSGSCCLGSVSHGIETAHAELNAENPDAPVPVVPPNRGERIAKIGTLVSAIMASSCCWLPLLLLAVGVSGAGIAATLETYRPAFMAVTFGFLAAAFYFTYRPRKSVAAGDNCCAVEQAAADDCYERFRTRRFSMIAMNKVMLWGVTVLAVAFLLFPSYVGTLLGTTSDTSVTENMNRVVIHIEGMTCEGCATTVAQAIRRVPGVAAVEVSYERSEAIVGVEPGNDIPVSKVLAALRDAGYDGNVPTNTSIESDHPDDPAAVDEPQNIETTETVFRVDGMSCDGCATALTESLLAVPGVTGARVDFKSGRAYVQNPSCCKPPSEAVIQVIETSGFRGQIEESPISQSPKGDPK